MLFNEHEIEKKNFWFLKTLLLEQKAIEMIKEIESIGTKNTTERALEMKKHFNNRAKDYCGWYGRIFELYCAVDNSRKKAVSSSEKNDNYFYLKDDNGKIKRVPVEDKTNGGRIESLYKKGAPKYICYSMFVLNSIVKTPRVLDPILIKTEDFLRVLEECNAIKCTNGKNPERAIQCTSKKLYNRLSNYPIPYSKELIYCNEDFEELDI